MSRARTLALVAALLCAPGAFAFNWTKAAAVTTIAVNVLEIKTTATKAIKAARTVRKTTVKAVKKVAGK